MRIVRLSVLAALALSGAVSAQIGSGRSGMSSTDRLDNVRAFGDLRAFGICYARTQRRDALVLIATTPGSREESEAFGRLVYGERTTCMFGGTTFRMSTAYARGAIVEGLLRSGGVPPEYLLPAPAPTEVRDLGGAGRCFVSRHRAQAQALLESTEVGTPEELAAVGALWSDFRTCIPGFQVRLNAPWIRYLVAEGMLRLAPASTTPSAD